MNWLIKQNRQEFEVGYYLPRIEPGADHVTHYSWVRFFSFPTLGQAVAEINYLNGGTGVRDDNRP